jgi:hypothetical protein
MRVRDWMAAALACVLVTYLITVRWPVLPYLLRIPYVDRIDGSVFVLMCVLIVVAGIVRKFLRNTKKDVRQIYMTLRCVSCRFRVLLMFCTHICVCKCTFQFVLLCYCV